MSAFPPAPPTAAAPPPPAHVVDGPLTFSGVLGASFGAWKSAFGQFFLLGLMYCVASTAAVMLPMAVLFWASAGLSGTGVVERTRLEGVYPGAVAAIVVAVFLTILVGLKVSGAMVGLSLALHEGRPPRLLDAWRASSGVARRGMGLAAVVTLTAAALLAAPLLPLLWGSREPTVVLAVVLLVLASWLAWIALTGVAVARWNSVLPLMVMHRLGGLSAMRRSAALLKGRRARALGAHVIVWLVVSTLLAVAYVISQLLAMMIPMAPLVFSPPSEENSQATVVGMVAAMGVAGVLVALLNLVACCVTAGLPITTSTALTLDALYRQTMDPHAAEQAAMARSRRGHPPFPTAQPQPGYGTTPTQSGHAAAPGQPGAAPGGVRPQGGSPWQGPQPMPGHLPTGVPMPVGTPMPGAAPGHGHSSMPGGPSTVAPTSPSAPGWGTSAGNPASGALDGFAPGHSPTGAAPAPGAPADGSGPTVPDLTGFGPGSGPGLGGPTTATDAESPLTPQQDPGTDGGNLRRGPVGME